MKRLLLLCLLTSPCWAHPLSWMAGTYHGSHDGAQLEESWTDTDTEMLGSTVWVEDGRVGMRELFRIRLANNGYHLDLWLTFSDGLGKHLQLDGQLEGKEKVVFRKPGESLTFRREAKNLVVELQKKELTVFQLEPGPAPSQTIQPQGEYILHTYLDDHEFADELNWKSKTLAVPGKWQANLENVKPVPGGTSFEITVPEGKQPYRVRYVMHFNGDMSQATGTLVNLTTGQTMGSFVAIRR